MKIRILPVLILAGLILTAQVNAQIIVTHYITCKGAPLFNNGALQVIPNPGDFPGPGPYTYSWNTGEVTDAITNQLAGLHTVTVTDAGLDPPVVYSYFLPAYQAVTGNINITDVTCNGASDGTAEADFHGGTESYFYLWSPGNLASQLITNLGPGAYSVTVTDDDGCTAMAGPVIITQPNPLTITNSSTTDVACFGNSTGAIDNTTAGGTPPYVYAWKKGGISYPANTEDLENITFGTYEVTVTDHNGCTAATPVALPTIIQPAAALTITNDSIHNATCPGYSNGEIFNHTAGGSGGNTYVWFRNGSLYPAAAILSPNTLPAGTYSVTATDNKGCTFTLGGLAVAEPNATTVTEGYTNIDCYGNSTGSWSIKPKTMGLPLSTYNITFNPPIFQNSPAVASGNTVTKLNIPAGTYTVTVVDNLNSCALTLTHTFTQPPLIQGHVTKTDLTCQVVPPVNNGTAEAVYSGGTGTLTYSWNTVPLPTPGPILTAQPTGTYTVNVSDVNGCSVSASVTINQPPALAITNDTRTNVLCFGNSTGAIENTTTGGTPPYIYTWTKGGVSYPANTEDLANIPSGLYAVTVTDNNGCTAATAIPLILQPVAALTVTNTPPITNVSCAGYSNGIITNSTAGGSGGNTYVWFMDGAVYPAATTLSPNNLPAGTYSVTVMDGNGCTASLGGLVVAEPNATTITEGYINVTCYGGNNGGWAITPTTSGIPVYTYTVTFNTVPPTFATVVPVASGSAAQYLNLVAGTYTAVVVDNHGCTWSYMHIVTQPPLIQGHVTKTDLTCNVAPPVNNGTAEAVYSGGTGTLTYSWNTLPLPTPGPILTAQPTGTYTVTVSDGNACTITASITIGQPPALTFTYDSKTDVLCFGNSTGAINNTTGGGTPPYIYTWTRGGVSYPANTEDLENIPAGLYAVTVTDNNGCTATTTPAIPLIQQPAAALTISNVAVTNITCNGLSNGAINLTVAGGTPFGAPPLYTCTWTGPITPPASLSINNLPYGDYSYLVTDANGCKVTGSVHVSQPTPILVTPTIVSNLCYGGSTGSISLAVSGGTPGVLPAPLYTVTWTGPITPPASLNINNLPAGTYTYTVLDANLCPSIGSVNVGEPSLILVTPTIVPNDCYGDSIGSIALAISGGTPAGAPPLYTVGWIGPGGFVSAVQNISGLVSGDYYYTVIDSHSCVVTGNVYVSQPSPIVVTPTVVSNDCYGNSIGSINLQLDGGTATYIVSWAGPYGFSSLLQNISALYSGDYTYNVTDINGCSVSGTVYVDQPSPLVITPLVTHNICYGDTNGQINMLFSGGTLGFTCLWTHPPDTTHIPSLSLHNLASGDYNYYVTDGNGCQIQGQVRIEPLMPLQGYIIKHDILCAGGTGSAESIFSGGSGYISHHWSTGQITPAIIVNAPGIITDTVTDSAGCKVISSVVINSPPAINIVLNSIDSVSCYGLSDGAINLAVGGGTAPYTYSWLQNGFIFPAVTQDLANIPAGIYYLTVTDAHGCLDSASYHVFQPPQTFYVDSVHLISCNNGSDGYWSIMPIGADTPYVAIFIPFSIMSTDTVLAPYIKDLVPGTYQCVITGASGCQSVFSMTFEQPLPITVGLNDIVPVLCYGDSTGSITLDAVHGGLPPYKYHWSNAMLSSSISLVPAGMYTVTITDSLNCAIHETYEVEQPYEPIKFIPTITNTSCPTDSDGNIVLYQENIFWSPFPNVFTIHDSLGNLLQTLNLGESSGNLAPGKYIALLVNSNGCSARDTFNVAFGNGICDTLVEIPNTVTANGDGINDVFSVGGKACENDDFLVLIFTDVGVKVFQSEDCNFKWDPRAEVKYSSGTVFYYYIKVTKNGKIHEYRNSINVIY